MKCCKAQTLTGQKRQTALGNCDSGFAVFLWRILKKGAGTNAESGLSQCPAVESIPDKVSGAWMFRDTRLAVATVIENLEDLSVEEVIERIRPHEGANYRV